MRIGAEVYLWGNKIGTVVQDDITIFPQFSYDREFLKSGIELSPIKMPLSKQVYKPKKGGWKESDIRRWYKTDEELKAAIESLTFYVAGLKIVELETKP